MNEVGATEQQLSQLTISHLPCILYMPCITLLMWTGLNMYKTVYEQVPVKQPKKKNLPPFYSIFFLLPQFSNCTFGVTEYVQELISYYKHKQSCPALLLYCPWSGKSYQHTDETMFVISTMFFLGHTNQHYLTLTYWSKSNKTRDSGSTWVRSAFHRSKELQHVLVMWATLEWEMGSRLLDELKLKTSFVCHLNLSHFLTSVLLIPKVKEIGWSYTFLFFSHKFILMDYWTLRTILFNYEKHESLLRWTWC